MGANVTKEYASTWNDDEVKKWKESAISLLRSYYLGFGGSIWDQYIVGTEDVLLLKAKICFAMYGPPTVEDADVLWNAYDSEKRKNAEEILETILEVHKKNNSSDKLLVGIITVACKQEKNEFPISLFSVFTGSDPHSAHASRVFVDSTRRTYVGWDDWKKNNTLPMLKYAYPRLGYYTCSTNGGYEFDRDRNPDIEFATSPACNVSSRIFGTTDIVAGITSFGCGVIGVASMFTPIGPAVLLTSAIAGGSSALYGTSRAVVRVYDKSTHGERLTDLESFTLYFSIAATPLHFTTSLVNGVLVRGAVVNGRIFSNSMRLFATVLNFSTLGVDGVMIAFGIANMVDKYNKNQLKPLDVLQFSMSVFFFTNTLIQPKMASTIIRNAQESHIQAYANNMQDADAQASFNRFLDENKGKGTITDNSKIIRTINRINDPNQLFGNLKDVSSVKIGGRKGKTLLISDKNNTVNRINPNAAPTIATINQGLASVNIQRDVKKCLKNIDSANIEVNGNKIFDNMTEVQKSRVNKVFGGSAGKNEQVILEAVDISKQMQLTSLDDVLSIVEILSAQLKQENPETLMKNISPAQIGSINKETFIAQIQNDCNVAMDIAQRNNINFKDPLLAVYHYRKHGSDFPSVIRNQKIEVYLTKVPASIIQDANLATVETVNRPEGESFVRKYYITPKDEFAIVIEKLDGTQLDQTISSIYCKPDSYGGHRANFATEPNWNFGPINGITEQIAKSMGFRGVYSIFINTNRERFEYTN